jgi:hypothetical protein
LKLKPVPIVLAIVLSGSLLFGGWFAYHSVAMENPLNQTLAGAPGVESSEVKLTDDKTVFHVKLGIEANVREIVHEIQKKNAEVAGKRAAEIRVTSNTSPELDAWWAGTLFGVAQAMETSQYAQIPVTLEQKAGELAGLTVQTEMDDSNVYVRLTEGEHVKFIILPRNPARMGVWSND